METKKWIDEHPNATLFERVTALATSLIGHATGPSSSALENFGFHEEWDVSEEDIEICRAFDAIIMRCEYCDYWVASRELDESGYCAECRRERKAKEVNNDENMV